MEKPQFLDPEEHRLQVMLSDKLQIGDVLTQMLAFCGPSDVVVSTFSSGEEFLRKMALLRIHGQVGHATLYTDMKAAEKTSRIIPLMRNAFDEVHMTKNHSKVLLLEGKHGRLTLLTSQNQTRGNRTESYCLINDDAVYYSIYNELHDLLTYSLL